MPLVLWCTAVPLWMQPSLRPLVQPRIRRRKETQRCIRPRRSLSGILAWRYTPASMLGAVIPIPLHRTYVNFHDILLIMKQQTFSDIQNPIVEVRPNDMSSLTWWKRIPWEAWIWVDPLILPPGQKRASSDWNWNEASNVTHAKLDQPFRCWHWRGCLRRWCRAQIHEFGLNDPTSAWYQNADTTATFWKNIWLVKESFRILFTVWMKQVLWCMAAP